MTSLVEKLFGSNGSRLSYRRLLVFAVVSGAATYLVQSGGLDGDQWVEIVKWVSVVFIGVEGVDKVAGAYGKFATAANPQLEE